MIQILVNGQPLDVLNNPDILITRSIADIREPQQRESEYTKSFEIPGTAQNNKLFSHIFEIEQTVYGTNFNPNKKANVIIFVDGIEQMRGFLRLVSISVDDSTEIQYQVTCHGQSADLFTTIGERKLNELNFTEYNHTLSSGNVVDSWATQIFKNGSPQAFALGDGYVYSMIDKGHIRSIELWQTNEFTPCLYAKTVVDKIFANTGYSYTNDSYFNDNRFKRLILPNPSSLKSESSVLELRRFRASRTTTAQSLDLASTLIFQNDSTSGNFDNGGNYNNTTAQFTAPVGGNFTFELGLELDFASTGYAPVFQEDIQLVFGLYTNGKLNTSTTVTVDFGSPAFPVIFNFKPLTLLQSDVVEFKLVQVYDAANSHNLTNAQFSLTMGIGSYLENDQTAYSFGYGEIVDFGVFLNSELKQSDLLMSFVKMFNLYIEPNRDNPKQLRIVPRDTFFNGSQLDWTKKLDYSQAVEIVPMGELDANPYNFVFKEGKDEANKFYQENYQTTYGSRSYKVDNDFVKNEKKIEIAFVPTQIQSYSGQKNFVLSYVPNPQDGDLRILYYGGLVTGVNWRLWTENAGLNLNYVNRFAIPLTLHYDSIDAPTFDILFGMPREIGIGAGYKYTNSNLVNNFYYKFLTEITNKNSKIVRAYFRITVKDYLNLSFADAYFFEGQYWRLNKIEDYNPNGDGVYLCEFLLAQFVQPATIAVKRIGAGTGRGADIVEGDIYPGGDIPIKPGIKGVTIGVSQGGGGVLQGETIVQNSTNTSGFAVLTKNTTFQAGTDNSGTILCEDFVVTKPETLYIGNYEIYPSFLSGGAVQTITTSYTATKDDYLFLLSPIAGGMVLTLPDPTGLSGKHFAVKKIVSGHTVTIDTTGTAKIDGADTHSISTQWAAHEIVTDGIDYFLMGEK